MIHYSCDRCKREIDPDHDLHYVVRIEIESMADMLPQSPDHEEDHLVTLDTLLESSDSFEQNTLSSEAFQTQRYDLCHHCYRQFAKNPLGREAISPMGFSEN